MFPPAATRPPPPRGRPLPATHRARRPPPSHRRLAAAGARSPGAARRPQAPSTSRYPAWLRRPGRARRSESASGHEDHALGVLPTGWPNSTRTARDPRHRPSAPGDHRAAARPPASRPPQNRRPQGARTVQAALPRSPTNRPWNLRRAGLPKLSQRPLRARSRSTLGLRGRPAHPRRRLQRPLSHLHELADTTMP